MFLPPLPGFAWREERFFRDLTVNRLRRGIFRSVDDLIAAIEEYLLRHNQDPKPFIWKKSAKEDILDKSQPVLSRNCLRAHLCDPLH